MSDLFFTFFSVIFPLLFFSIFFFVTVIIIKEFSSVNKIKKHFTAQVISNIKPDFKNESSRTDFFNTKKNSSNWIAYSNLTNTDVVKDKPLSEAEKNVLYGK